MSKPVAFLYSHQHAEGIKDAVAVTRAAAERHGWDLIDADEADNRVADLCIVLGGDGSMLAALRQMIGTDTPVFGVNFGRVGFLTSVEAADMELGLDRAFAGDYELFDLPGLEITVEGEKYLAINDVSFSRKPRSGVAELSYRISGEEVGHVRCDGLVASTATGSTGYNLANHGPILAWGVQGYAVSYIAPHTLTGRPLVVAPTDVMHVVNHRGRDGVDTTVDGVLVAELAPSAEAEIRFVTGLARLAQLPGASFYQRIGVKFGHLAI